VIVNLVRTQVDDQIHTIMNAIAIAVIVITILIVIWFLFQRRNSTARIRALLNESGGSFDQPARAAFDTICKKKSPSAEDLFMRAEIRWHNMLGCNPRTFHDQPQALVEIANDYGGALRGLTATTMIPHDFIAHRVMDFGAIIHPEAEADYELAQLIGMIEPVIIQNAAAVHAKDIHTKKHIAKSKAKSHADVANIYLGDSLTHTSDPQNVHDSKVNHDLRATLDKIRLPNVTNQKIDTVITQLTEYTRTIDIDEKAKNHAMMTLEIIKSNAVILTFNDTEGNILYYVWQRACHPANAKNIDLIKRALVIALAECIDENEKPLCINGRCGRMLSSLVLLDFDDSVGKAQTYEGYKNQIFDETRRLINDAVEMAKQSDDPKMRAVAMAYNGDMNGSEIDPDTEHKFMRDLRTAIDLNIDSYTDKLTNGEMSWIRTACHEAIN
jgi:hypothetical protein